MRSLRSKMHVLTGITLVAVIAGMCIFAGCNTSGCVENRSAVPMADLYSSATGEAITLDSLQIHGIGAPGDSMLVSPGQRVSQIYLPMRANMSQTAWCIAYKWKTLDFPDINDTVKFSYTAKPWFAGEECGAMYYYQIHSVDYTTHLLDSVVISDSLITNINVATIRMYFRTAQNPEEE